MEKVNEQIQLLQEQVQELKLSLKYVIQMCEFPHNPQWMKEMLISLPLDEYYDEESESDDEI